MNTQVIPIAGYISPTVLLTMAAREFDRAKDSRTWAPAVESEAHQTLAGRYFAEAANQHQQMRGRS